MRVDYRKFRNDWRCHAARVLFCSCLSFFSMGVWIAKACLMIDRAVLVTFIFFYVCNAQLASCLSCFLQMLNRGAVTLLSEPENNAVLSFVLCAVSARCSVHLLSVSPQKAEKMINKPPHLRQSLTHQSHQSLADDVLHWKKVHAEMEIRSRGRIYNLG